MSTKGSPEQRGTPPTSLHNTNLPTGGPAPLPPQPEPPRISAAELALLTEAAATKNGTFQCTLCSKQFGYKNGLIRHVRLTHVGEKPYQCNICNRRFGYKHILMEHQNLHFGNRPYACNMCDKKFAARSNLIQHRMVHKRPFHCTLCNKRFDREDQLKKHLFAHPQSLLCCSICKYTATSQKDLNKHMADAHPSPSLPESSPMSAAEHTPPTPEANSCDVRPPVSGGGLNLPYNGMGHTEMTRTEPITPPDSAEEQPHMATPPSSLAQTRIPPLSHALTMDGRGYRIDAICSQLSTGIGHYPPPGFPHNLYHGVIVKKEYSDEGEWAFHGPPNLPADRPHMPESPRSDNDFHPRTPSSSDPPHLGPPFSQISSSPDHPHSAPTPQTSMPPYLSPSGPSLTPDSLNMKPSYDDKQPAVLPSIHEVFTRRGMPSNSKLPPFNSLSMPNLLPNDSRIPGIAHPEMTLSPPPTSYSSSSGSSANGPMFNHSNRPTAQLPPITQVLHHTRDQGTQYSAQIPGFPSLEDVLSYYIGLGLLFKCQHCNILFFERGMYFLHASLHGPSSPWECSICHTVCSDKNEFTIHFVNQQHHT